MTNSQCLQLAQTECINNATIKFCEKLCDTKSLTIHKIHKLLATTQIKVDYI